MREAGRAGVEREFRGDAVDVVGRADAGSWVAVEPAQCTEIERGCAVGLKMGFQGEDGAADLGGENEEVATGEISAGDGGIPSLFEFDGMG